jgi:hypothetical protein
MTVRRIVSAMIRVRYWYQVAVEIINHTHITPTRTVDYKVFIIFVSSFIQCACKC